MLVSVFIYYFFTPAVGLSIIYLHIAEVICEFLTVRDGRGRGILWRGVSNGWNA
jgi:hypothetical protein